jgi:hypothetical protein
MLDQEKFVNVAALFCTYSGSDEIGGMVVLAERLFFGHHLPVVPWGNHKRW